MDQVWKSSQKKLWLAQSADQVGSQHEIKPSQPVRQIHGIASLKSHTPTIDVRGNPGLGWRTDVTFGDNFVGQDATFLEGAGCLDKGTGKINSYYFLAGAAEFEA